MRVFILILVSGFLNAQVNSFSLNVNGTPPVGFTTALNIAAEKWSQYLQVSVPIKVNVFTVNSGLLPFSAITVANGRKDFSNAPVTNTLYTTALANQLAGTETNPGEFDMDIYFNLASSYYFGTGKPAANQKDFISTAMHEIGHGLGFYSTGYVNNSGSGSFGNVPSSVLFPLVPSFPWHGQDGVPCIYDKFIKKQSGSIWWVLLLKIQTHWEIVLRIIHIISVDPFMLTHLIPIHPYDYRVGQELIPWGLIYFTFTIHMQIQLCLTIGEMEIRFVFRVPGNWDY